MRNEGWFIDVISRDRPSEEYLTLVNTPLRESNDRVLGPSLHTTSEQSLSHPREMLFLLTEKDYARVAAAHKKAEFLEGNQEVLEEANRNYQLFLKLINTVPVGRLNLPIISYKVDPNTGFPVGIRFKALLTAPSTFKFPSHLRPAPTS